MKKNNFKGCLILALTAIIWGVAFIAQKEGMDYVGPLTFTFSRSLLGTVALFPVALLLGKKKPMGKALGFGDKTLLKAGLLSGLFLFGATACQQIGMQYTTAGKAAFITALYIVFAPVVGIFLGKKAGLPVWVGVLLGGVGMYLLCMTGESGIGRGDLIVFLCSLLFTGQILVIDRYSQTVDCIRMSCLQFAVCTVLSGIGMLLFETPQMGAILDCAVPILYAGILSSAVAYTLQIVGQKYADVTPATLAMSLESVFAALAGWLILKETMSVPEILGCVLIFVAIVVAQLPTKRNS
ncbi:MAG: DMT family transporter [Ruminococcaceae bacterium]|nr:DMT family transporter [Oscillospiraceae bacterium]